MVSIRQKLIIGFSSLFAVIMVICALNISQVNRLGQAIDIVFKENYRSVIACQDMKESLERIDSGLLYILIGKEELGINLINENISKFKFSLDLELNNITLPNEGEKSQKIKAMFEEYQNKILLITSKNESLQTRQDAYFSKAQPLFIETKKIAEEILIMNQTNMVEENLYAKQLASKVQQRMFMAILVSALLALLFIYLAQKWILKPINLLIKSTNEIQQGNLNLVIETKSKDEIGQLSGSFNDMAASLRQARKEENINLLRTRRATEDVFKALPTAMAVLNLEGRIETSTETARKHFGLKKGLDATKLGYEWLAPLMQKAIREKKTVERDAKSGYVQQFVDNHEYFFQPMVVPIPVESPDIELTGVALILKDVTQVNEQLEMKRSVVSTVSHQLKTPLTSLCMSIHLLLEEKIGNLNGKQVELLVTAREDSSRLVEILDELLDINRMEAGKSNVFIKPIQPEVLVRDAIELVAVEAKDKGILIVNEISNDLPDVLADAGKIRHVFLNLFSNAFRFTKPGGTITLRAEMIPDFVQFYVEDTGKGIPSEHIKHLFNQFYRVPGQDEKSGVGLGLSIVKEIILAHGGTVSIESEFGKGAVLCFTLPINKKG